MVYPHYEHYPLEGDSDMEAKIHAYLVRMNRLCGPLPARCDLHEQLFKPAFKSAEAAGLPKHQPRSLTVYVTKKDVVGMLRNVAATVLLLILCGHGRSDGAFQCSDGAVITRQEIMVHAAEGNIKTLICVYNMCHAEGPPPPSYYSYSSTPPAKPLPFSWINIYSSSNREVQNAEHCNHVARVLAGLIAEAPDYSKLQERVDALWGATRDSQQPPHMWRGPPVVECGGRYNGKFLKDVAVASKGGIITAQPRI
jgi:hypothetical protein